MRVTDLITKKKHNKALTTEEINWLIDGYTKGDIPDYQMSAFLMAVYFNGLDRRETVDMTIAMRDSGDTLDLSMIRGFKIDKHSSGGVGDKVSLVLIGIIGALDVPFTKMSGRGLGHTGGTIDKLESIPGFRTNLTMEEFIENVNSINVAIAGQTKDLAPADKKIYALRDITATVDEISLISSSIMSKKLASGCDGIVLDVTVGSGAFMTNIDDARALSQSMVDIGKSLDKRTLAVITNMDEPLGYAIGNSLEVVEAVHALQGNGPADLMEVVYELASYMLLFAERVDSICEAKSLIDNCIQDGSAYNKFLEFVAKQGGDTTCIDNLDKLPQASFIHEVKAKESGFVKRIDALRIGHASLVLGGGRENLNDIIDPSVGIVLNKKVADEVSQGDVIAYIHGNDIDKIKKAEEDVLSAYTFTANIVAKPQMILDIIK